jgi:long-chain fatty acid transport protein
LRRRSIRFTSLAVVLLASLASTSPLAASGFSIFEQGAKATGMGGAFAATADDPSAMFYNVSGIAYQRELGAYAGATVINFANGFEGADDSYPGPVTARYEGHTFTPPNMYAIVPIGENATLGFAQFTAFGLRTDWEEGNTFPGRFISQDANLKTASLQPSFAMKTSDGRFAWGLGVEYRTSHITLERNNAAINPFTQRITDVAHVRLDSEWNHGWGWNAGLMFRPNDTWSVGLSYRSDMEIDYEGEADFQQILTGFPQFDAAVAAQLPPDQGIDTTINYPAFVHFGIATTRWDKWQVEFDAVYNTWSEFEALIVEFEQSPAVNLNSPQEWDDSYSLRLGGNRSVTDNWDVRLGAVYDKSPQPVERVGPLLPDSDRVGISFGLGYKRGHWRIDATEMALAFIDRDTLGRNAEGFNGEYETAANLFSLNVGYNF